MASLLEQLQDDRLKKNQKVDEIANRLDDANHVWNGEDQAEFERACADYKAAKAALDAENDRLAKVASIKQTQQQIADESRNYRLERQTQGGGNVDLSLGRTDQKSDADHLAMGITAWLRQNSGGQEISADEKRSAQASGINLMDTRGFTVKLNRDMNRVRQAASAIDGPSGGMLVGETIMSGLEKAMLYSGPMLQVANVVRTPTGEPWKMFGFNDTANTGRQLGESAAPTTGTDLAFTGKVLSSYKLTSDVLFVPYEALRDINGAFNIVSEITTALGERLGRLQNTKTTTGTGAATYTGIITDAVSGVTAASATAIAADEIIGLEHSVDIGMRKQAGSGYMAHDTVWLALRKLKDGSSRYLWQAGFNTGAPDTLNGYPWYVNNDMASSIAASAKTLLFGNFKKFFIRQVESIRFYRLTEKYRDVSDSDAFLAFIEGDSKLNNHGGTTLCPVKYITQAA